MTTSRHEMTVADALVQRLRDHGVTHVFGYPGGQLAPVYDALYRQAPRPGQPVIRHVLARDEAAAAFMADGYARATGRPGICLAVCGPGLLNAATPLATAYSDSVPVLLISGQVHSKGVGPRSGYYHENDQLRACVPFTKDRLRIAKPASVYDDFDRAFLTVSQGRPGPVVVESPVDVLRSPCPAEPPDLVPTTMKFPVPTELAALATELRSWKRPVLLAGGGCLASHVTPLLTQLADRLGAPVFNTAMGKGTFPADHPRAAGFLWSRATSDLSGMNDFFSPVLAEADGLLAVGCRFTQLATGSWTMPVPPRVAQIDIDRDELGRHYTLAVGVCSDARLALVELLSRLPHEPRTPWATLPPREPWRLPGIDLIGPLRAVLPRDGIVVADITRLAYMMMVGFPCYQPRTFLHPTGSVAMGYALPAALGARAAFPDRPIVCVIGDGGFQMCGMELASMVQENLPVVVVLINDNCLTLIKSLQDRKYDGRHVAVDLKNPDFVAFASAFGVRAWRADNDQAFEAALREALASGGPALVEVVLPEPVARPVR